jgi:hypothetical protein
MEIHKAIFSRGTGLGNRLFPWARAVVSSEFKKENLARPKWENVRLAPLIAGNISFTNLIYKFYLIDNFKLEPIRFLRRKQILHKGLGNYFEDLWGFEKLLYIEFSKHIKLSKPKHYYRNLAKEYPIILNIRGGNDFTIKYDLDFYLKIINQIQSLLEKKIKFGLITDSEDEALISSLRSNGCFLIRNKKAVDDLYLLCQTAAIIGSGGSSFCCWPAFFKTIPLIIQPNTPHEYFKTFSPQNSHFLMQKDILTETDINIIKSKLGQ